MADTISKTATIVQKAGGDIVAFNGFVAKFIVAHPRWSTLIAAVLGAVVGHIL